MVKRLAGSEVEPVSVKSNVGLLDTLGREIVDGRPMSPPLGYKKTPSISEQIREMVRSHALEQALASGVETFAEADDFEVGDDLDPSSPYEEYFDPGTVAEFQARMAAEAALPPIPRSEPFVPPAEPSTGVKPVAEPPKAAEE